MVELPPELQPMPLNLKLMELVGLWGDRNKLHRFLLLLGWGTAIILLPKVALGMGSTDFDAIAKGWAEFLFEANLFVAVAIFALKGTTFGRMIDGLRGFIQEVTNQSEASRDFLRNQNVKINKFVKFYAAYCCFGPFVFCVPPMIGSYRMYFAAANTSEPLSFKLPMEQAFYGLQIRTNFAHYHLFVGLSVVAYCVCSYLSVIKVSTLLVMIRYSSLTYRVVALRIHEFAQLPARVKATATRLEDIVELHQRAFDVTALVEEICCIPMAMQFLTCAIFWCLTMFYVSTNVNSSVFNVMVPFWLSLIETYGFSYLGSELSSSAGAVGSAIYDLEWYNDAVQLQRYYRLVLQRTQQRTGITAAKFSLVGLGTFGSVAHLSYSYYLVLKDVLHQKRS